MVGCLMGAVPRLARDLVVNPVECQVYRHPVEATLVFEAVIPDGPHEVAHKHWLICTNVQCIALARFLAGEFCPVSTEVRDATVVELEEYSGLDVAGVQPAAVVAGAA
jgi:hypothetical protein